MTIVGPALTSALSTVLPDEAETTLLRACLLEGDPGITAWEGLLERASDPRAEVGSAAWDRWKCLLPLLFVNLKRNRVDPGRAWGTLLRAAYLHESLRARAYYRVLRGVLGSLDQARVQLVALKGAALGITSYPDAKLRHSHNIELFVRRGDHDRATSTLLARGFIVHRRGGGHAGPVTDLLHASGLPLRLTTRLYPLSFYRSSWDATWKRGRRLAGPESGLRMPSLADALVHACADAVCRPARVSLLWVSDASMIARRLEGELWDEVRRIARWSRLELPLYVTLAYLESELGAPVPSDFLHRLRESLGDRADVHRDMALLAARRGSSERVWRMLRRVPSWRDRAVLFGWLAVPSRRYVRWRSKERGGMLLPLYYLYRLAAETWRAARRSVRTVVSHSVPAQLVWSRGPSQRDAATPAGR